MAEILHQLINSLSHYLRGFIHPRWLFGMSSINGSNNKTWPSHDPKLSILFSRLKNVPCKFSRWQFQEITKARWCRVQPVEVGSWNLPLFIYKVFWHCRWLFGMSENQQYVKINHIRYIQLFYTIGRGSKQVSAGVSANNMAQALTYFDESTRSENILGIHGPIVRNDNSEGWKLVCPVIRCNGHHDLKIICFLVEKMYKYYVNNIIMYLYSSYVWFMHFAIQHHININNFRKTGHPWGNLVLFPITCRTSEVLPLAHLAFPLAQSWPPSGWTTHLKNISQVRSFPSTGMNIKSIWNRSFPLFPDHNTRASRNIWNHHPDIQPRLKVYYKTLSLWFFNLEPFKQTSKKKTSLG